MMRPARRAAILGLAAILIGFPIPSWVYFVTHGVPDGHADFRANYIAGYMLRTGKPLFDYASELENQNLRVSPEAIALPFVHPAYEALLYLPLSFFSYLEAYWIWFALNLLIIAYVCRLLRPEWTALSAVAPWLPAGAFAAFLPIGLSIVQGQDSLLVLLFLTLAFALFRYPKRLVMAGVFLGLALFRFHIIVPIVVCLLFWRRWKVVTGFLSTALVEAALSVAIAGFWPYVHRVLGLSFQPDRAYSPAISRMPTLRGLIHSVGGADWLVLVVSVTVLAMTVRAGSKCGLTQQFSLAVTAAVLVSYHGFVYDLSVLLIPLTLLMSKKDESAFAVIGICFFTPILLAFAPDRAYLGVCAVAVLFIFLVVTQCQSQRVWSFQVSSVP